MAEELSSIKNPYDDPIILILGCVRKVGKAAAYILCLNYFNASKCESLVK